jgi:hypothetical protein
MEAGCHLARFVRIGGSGWMKVEKLAERIRGEFDEMPELVLTLPQASRFFGIEQELMQSVTNWLIESDYLRLTRAGAIARAPK